MMWSAHEDGQLGISMFLSVRLRDEEHERNA